MSEISEMPRSSTKKEGWLGSMVYLDSEGVAVLGGSVDETGDIVWVGGENNL